MESELAPRPLAAERRRRLLRILVVLVAVALVIAALVALGGTVFADPMAGT